MYIFKHALTLSVARDTGLSEVHLPQCVSLHGP